MPGTTHAASSSTDTTTPPGVRDDVDLDRTVWFGGGEAYHRATEWGPACPDQIGRCDEHTLADAVDENLRPCRQCEPVDYRRLATDGGHAPDVYDVPGHGRLGGVDDPVPREEYGDVVSASHERDTELESALDHAMEAAGRADELDVDAAHAARLRLAEEGLRVAFYAEREGERELALDDGRRHLEVAVDELDETDVTHPARHALQMLVAREDRLAPDPEPVPRPTPNPTTSKSNPFGPFKRTIAGTFSTMTALGAGLALSHADFITTTETPAGTVISGSPPGAPFWVAIALMLVSTLLVAYATTGGRR